MQEHHLRNNMVLFTTSSNPPLLITVPVPSQECERSVCVKGIDFASFCNCSNGFWNCSASGIFWLFILFIATYVKVRD